MAHLHRFHIPLETDAGREIVLAPEEAHHALRVVRLRLGDEVALFDGHGREILGEVARLGKREVVVRPSSERSQPRLAPEITLALAWLHREKAIEHAVRHGTVLGVSRFRFFRADRSERGARPSPKWTRWAVEACKQCGRLWLPEFEVHDGLDDVLAQAAGEVLLLAMEGEPVPWGGAVTGKDVTLIVGPEGDFSPEEIAGAAGLGARHVSLGETVFRSEAAATAALTLVQHYLGGLGAR